MSSETGPGPTGTMLGTLRLITSPRALAPAAIAILTCLFLFVAPRAHAARGMEVALEDEPVFLNQFYYNRDQAFQQARRDYMLLSDQVEQAVRREIGGSAPPRIERPRVLEPMPHRRHCGRTECIARRVREPSPRALRPSQECHQGCDLRRLEPGQRGGFSDE